MNNLQWAFGCGGKILIGNPNMRGTSAIPIISEDLIAHLNGKGIFFLGQVIKEYIQGIPIWKTTEQMDLQGDMVAEWDAYNE